MVLCCVYSRGAYSISIISCPSGIGRGARLAGTVGPNSTEESSLSDEPGDGARRCGRGGGGEGPTHRATTGGRGRRDGGDCGSKGAKCCAVSRSPAKPSRSPRASASKSSATRRWRCIRARVKGVTPSFCWSSASCIPRSKPMAPRKATTNANRSSPGPAARWSTF